MRNIGPVPGYQAYSEPPDPGRSLHRQATTRRTAITICTIADIAAGLLGLGVLLFLLEAKRGNCS